MYVTLDLLFYEFYDLLFVYLEMHPVIGVLISENRGRDDRWGEDGNGRTL